MLPKARNDSARAENSWRAQGKTNVQQWIRNDDDENRKELPLYKQSVAGCRKVSTDLYY